MKNMKYARSVELSRVHPALQ